MAYVYWNKVFTVFGWSLWKCKECGTLHGGRSHGKPCRIWGPPCSRHL